MKFSVGLWITIVLWWTAASATAQAPPRLQSPESRMNGPDQPVRPQVPTLQQRAAPEQQPAAPFRLTPQEDEQVDRILRVWEQRSTAVRTFDCSFKRWEYRYEMNSGQAVAPRETLGIVRYAAPDKGMFQVQQAVQDGKLVAIDPRDAEHWVCDGKSIFEFNHATKQLTEFRLPPELHGKAIADGPLPFLFGAQAEKIKQRYYIRTVPSEAEGQQTWLKAFPRYQQDAANFEHAELILTNQNMTPFALKLYLPNGKDCVSYQFYEIVINDPLRLLKGDPFHVSTPLGWQKIVKEPATAQASRVPPVGARR